MALDKATSKERQRCLDILAALIKDLDNTLPDGHGGRFTKKFAENTLRGAMALIRKGNKP